MMDDRQFTTIAVDDKPGLGGKAVEGAEVFDVNGEKVGTVSEHGVQDSCLVVHHGLFRQDVYVPLETIGEGDEQGVYLKVTKDRALEQDWSRSELDELASGEKMSMGIGSSVFDQPADQPDFRLPADEK